MSAKNTTRIYLAGKRLLICEEGLIDYTGHFHTWIKAIRQINLDAGVTVNVAGNLRLCSAIKQEFNAIPTFSISSWPNSYHYHKWAWRRYAKVVAHNTRVLFETAGVLRKCGPVDTLLFTAVRIHHLLGLRALCAWGLGRHFKRLVCYILTSEAQYNSDFSSFKFKPSSRLIRWCLQSFAPLVQNGGVILAGDSHITCKEYETLSGVPMVVLPSPGGGLNYRDCKQEVTGGAGSNEAVPVFVTLGTSTFDKGIDLLQRAIIRLLSNKSNYPARFIVQWAVPTIDQEGHRIQVDERLRVAPQVQLVDRHLTNSEYTDMFQQADFVVLPYRKSTYINRLSGVAVEAACSGIPLIVTEGTWPAWAVNEFGVGLTVRDRDVEHLAEQIDYGRRHWRELASAAKARAQIALEYNSSSNYLNTLWNLQRF